VPNIHAQVQYSGDDFFGGAGIDYKKITPRLVTTNNIKTDNSVSSLAFTGFVKIYVEPVTFKFQGVYGGNLADQIMLGGYAVKSLDTLTGIEDYTVINCLSVWGEVSVGKNIEYAVFAGYTKSLGADYNIVGAYYGRGTNIENVFRVSPRVQFNFNSLRFSTELEYTSAGYGTPKNLNKGKIENVKEFTNLRILGAVYLFF
jgi:hypothetical protein